MYLCTYHRTLEWFDLETSNLAYIQIFVGAKGSPILHRYLALLYNNCGNVCVSVFVCRTNFWPKLIFNFLWCLYGFGWVKNKTNVIEIVFENVRFRLGRVFPSQNHKDIMKSWRGSITIVESIGVYREIQPEKFISIYMRHLYRYNFSSI